MTFREAIQTLTRLGLTLRQARVYLALVGSGTSTVKEISEASMVRREEVYRLMPKLQELSLVEKIITSPLKFNATPVQEGFFLLQKRRKKETSELNAKIKEALQNFKGNATRMTHQGQNPQFVLIPRKKMVINRRRKQIMNAQTTIDSLVSFRRFAPTMNIYSEVAKKALKRGVKVRVVTEKPENENDTPKTIQEFKKNPSFKFRYLLKPPLAILSIYDRKEVLVTTSAITDLGESPALWSNNPSVLAVFNDFYEMLWITAME